MKKNTHYKKNQPAFALIFVLLFVTLLLLTAATIWLTGLAEIRLQRRTEYSTGAYQLAKAGIEEGWVWYKNRIDSADPMVNLPQYPTTPNACTASGVHRVFSDGTTVPVDIASTSIPSITQTSLGVYDYRVCTSGTPIATTITSIGYYKGNKVISKGTVTHGTSEGSCTGGIGVFPSCIGSTPTWDHSHDTLTISQE